MTKTNIKIKVLQTRCAVATVIELFVKTAV